MTQNEETPAGANGGGPKDVVPTAQEDATIITSRNDLDHTAELRRALAARFSTHAHALPGKGEAKYACVKEAPPDPLPDGPIVLYPIAPGADRTRVGVLDFDDHDGALTWQHMVEAATPVVDHLQRLGHRPMPFRSTGGRGVHVWLVWDAPQSAAAVIDLLDEALAACGLDRGTGGVVKGEVEVFPKQAAVADGEVGNGIALPLAGDSVPLHPEGLDVLSKPRLLQSSRPLEVTPTERYDAEDPGEFDVDAVRSALQAVPADDYETWIDVLRALKGGAKRSGLPDDEAKELARGWSASSAKHDDRAFELKWSRAFRREERGQGRGLGTLFWHARQHGWEPPERPCVIEHIRIQESDPPLFLLTVTGSNEEVVMEAADLNSATRFPNRVLEKTYKIVRRPKDKELQRLLAQAERIPADETATTLGRFREVLWEFLDQYCDPEQEKLRLEHSWHDEQRKRMWFRWTDFETFLRRIRNHAFIGKHHEALLLVRAMGGDSGVLNCNGQSLRCWWVPSDDWTPSWESKLPPVDIGSDEVPF